MKTLLRLCLVVAFATSTAPLWAQSGYRLGSGDLISISVFEEPELSMEVRLGDSGQISYPFLGQVDIAERTIAEVETAIAEGLRGDYLIEPRVSISVMEYRPFFITGEVAAPGGYPYLPGLTLRKAITLAGGFTERASRSRIVVNRGDLSDDESRLQLSDAIHPDDVITVQQSFF